MAATNRNVKANIFTSEKKIKKLLQWVCKITAMSAMCHNQWKKILRGKMTSGMAVTSDHVQYYYKKPGRNKMGSFGHVPDIPQNTIQIFK